MRNLQDRVQLMYQGGLFYLFVFDSQGYHKGFAEKVIKEDGAKPSKMMLPLTVQALSDDFFWTSHRPYVLVSSEHF
jgi:hypothetical protein